MTTLSKSFYRPVTIETAPEASRPFLESVQKSLGFVPNLMATYANSPAVLQGYLSLDSAFRKSSFTRAEQQVILLTASVENDWDYCLAAHATVARQFKVPGPVIDSICQRSAVPDPTLGSLVELVREAIHERGHLADATVPRFLQAGYAKPHVMEILLGIALKTISTHLDHISPASIDGAFAGEGK
jgi:AhpD family alkylhydroperoxidase